MKILIVEDETAAVENLVACLHLLDEPIEICANTESVAQTVRWLREHEEVDLILMDIHLSDGSAFSVFRQVEVDTPVIFTTTYDRYALEAFRVNSIDYLLKPIRMEELRRAFDKYWRRIPGEWSEYLRRLPSLLKKPTYPERILVSAQGVMIPIPIEDISFFYTNDGEVSLHLRNGRIYSYGSSLDQVMQKLNPKLFMRVNKQFILARSSIREISTWFAGRLLVKPDVAAPERVLVSKNRAAQFKRWVCMG